VSPRLFSSRVINRYRVSVCRR